MSAEKFRTLDKLLEHLTKIMCNQVKENRNECAAARPVLLSRFLCC